MGALYLARDPGLERLVAIKLLKDEYQDDQELRERFTREARSVARLRHRNIIVVYEIGQDEGRPFMAMEYIEGETLAHVLRQSPPLPLARRLSLIEDLCDGLSHAHAAGIIHRDIKPANIMLDRDGVLKILDFGIARLGNSGMTQDGMMMGTVNYMSPEQVVGRGVDHRSDIFATGAVLYEVIALAQAFPGGIDTGVLHRILTEGPVPISERVPAIDAELAGIVSHALDRESTQRYQDATEMRRDIARVRRRLMEERHEPGSASPGDATLPPRARPSSAGRRSDSDRPRRLDPDRFAALQKQQVEEHLRVAEEAFARGEHDAALEHAERAATVDPDSRDAFDLIDRARFAIEAKAIRQLLAEANRLLSEGHIEDAAIVAEQASVTVRDLQGALELRSEVRHASERIAAARDRERRIQVSLERTRTQIEQGKFDSALRSVYEVLALDPERAEARELEQSAKSLLQDQREHEQARRRAYEQLSSARALAGAGRYEEATEAINAIAPPSDTVKVAASDALKAVLALQRQAAHTAIVVQARALFERQQFREALAALDSIPADDQTPDARSLRSAIEDALRAQREIEQKRRALETAITATRALIEKGDLTGAVERLESAATLGVSDERIPAMRQQIADLRAAAEERRRQEARDRQSATRVEEARQLLADGDGYAAIAFLERDGSGHELVEGALREIRAVVAEQEERESERKRQEEQRRREEVATLLISAEQALAADRPEQATLLLRRADEKVASVEDTALQRRFVAAKAEAEQRERGRRAVQDHLTRAREQLGRGNLEAAREAATAALAIDPKNQDALTALGRVDEEASRRIEEARQQEEARQEAMRLAEIEGARLREEQHKAAEKRRQEEEQRRQAEARRLEEQRAEDARKQKALADLLGQAGQTREHEAALTLLSRAETLAPSDSRIQTLIGERRAALDAQRAASRAAEDTARRERERLAQDERDGQAATLVEQARRLFDEGQHGEAVALLQGFPEHTLTTAAIVELESRHTELEHRRREQLRQHQRKQRRVATAAAIDTAIHDRRLHAVAAAVLVLALGWGVWQLSPSAPPQAGPTTTEGGGDTAGVTSRAQQQIGEEPTGDGQAGPAQAAGNIAANDQAAKEQAAKEQAAKEQAAKEQAARDQAARDQAAKELAVREQAAREQEARDQATREQAAREQAARDQAAREQAAREQAAREEAAREQAAREQAAREQAARAQVARDRSAIQQLLGQYVDAYSRLDEGRLRSIDPAFRGIQNRELIRTVQLSLSEPSITFSQDGQSAVLSAKGSYRYTWNRAGFPPTTDAVVNWNLRKVGANWVVSP
jgi:serine/threonine-protein kinase